MEQNRIFCYRGMKEWPRIRAPERLAPYDEIDSSVSDDTSPERPDRLYAPEWKRVKENFFSAERVIYGHWRP